MRIKEKIIQILAAGAIICTAGASSQAATVIGASSISSPQGSFSGFELEDAINQSGLSIGYTSGVTDFSTYTATATHDSAGSLNSGFTDTGGLPQVFSFDLGAETWIDGFAFWEVDNIGSVTEFELFADDNNDFSDGSSASLGSFLVDANGSGLLAQIGSFSSVSTQFIHLNATLPVGLFDGIGEFAFRSSVSVVPLPAAFPLYGAGIAVMGFMVWRRKRKTTD